METGSFSKLARRNSVAIPLLFWYVLLSSHVLLVVPATGVDQVLVDRRETRSHVNQRGTDGGGDSSDPFHKQHSRVEAYLCAACETFALIAETVPTIPYHRLEPSRTIDTRSTTFVGAVRVLDHPIPDSPLPDPPLKIPIISG